MRRLTAVSIIFGLLIIQVANAQTTRQRSNNYWVPTDVQPVGGGDKAKSSKYILDDTIGEANIGAGRSDNYDLQAGYRQTSDNAYIALNCDDVADLGSIVLSGQANGSATCTVTTDSDAGYSLLWKAGSDNKLGLVGQWKFDETTGTTAYDGSGLGNDASHTGSPTISTTIPTNYRSTRSIDLNGSSQYVTVPDAASLNLTSQLTISMWVNLDSVTGPRVLYLKGSTNPDVYNPLIQMNGAKIIYAWTNGASRSQYQTTNDVLSTGTWTHIAVTHVTGATPIIYINGVPVAAGFTEGNASLALAANSYSTTIGADANRSPVALYVDGKIDDVSTFNRSLAVAEIRDLASLAPPGSLVQSGSQVTSIQPILMAYTGGLMAHWKMDEPVAGTVADSSGFDWDGTPSGGPTPSQNVASPLNVVSDRSLSFDGTNDYVDMGDITGLSNASAITVSFWMKQNTLDVVDWIFSKSTVGGPRMTIVTWNDGNMYIEPTGSSNRGLFDYSTVITAGQWHMVTMVYDGTASGNANRLKAYVDGAPVTLSYQGTIPSTTQDLSGADLTIGENLQSSGPFAGSLDDMRIYSRALSAAEVAALYGTPQSWAVANNDARWAGRLSSTSTDTDAKWGVDSSTDKWLNVGEGTYPLVTRSTRTDPGGSTQILQFRAEIGATKIQRAGTYTSTLVVTAVAL